jgi:hypothetical protein
MGLCSDQPIALTSFNIQKAEEIVKKSPVIKEARLKLIKPDTVYIDYTARQPVAALLDFENVALDADLTPFPIAPFFSPKKLPGIYLGLKSFAWNTPLKDPRPRLALHVLKSLQNLSLHVKIVDVMNSCAPSLGKREIVIVLDEDGFSKYLRLTPKNFDQEIANYLQLRPNLPAEAQVIDLRVPHLGFIESITSNLHQFESDKVVQRTPSDK